MEIGDGRVAVLGDNYLTSAPEYLEAPFVEDENEARRGRPQPSILIESVSLVNTSGNRSCIEIVASDYDRIWLLANPQNSYFPGN